jgi:hypothetical protein
MRCQAQMAAMAWVRDGPETTGEARRVNKAVDAHQTQYAGPRRDDDRVVGSGPGSPGRPGGRRPVSQLDGREGTDAPYPNPRWATDFGALCLISDGRRLVPAPLHMQPRVRRITGFRALPCSGPPWSGQTGSSSESSWAFGLRMAVREIASLEVQLRMRFTRPGPL